MKHEEPIRLILYGSPVNQSRYHRPRHALWDEFCQASLAFELALKSQYGERSPLGGPLHLEATFFIQPAPKNMSKVGKFHMDAPELRGYLDFLERKLTGVVYHNIRDIACVTSQKRYDAVPRTEVIVRKL